MRSNVDLTDKEFEISQQLKMAMVRPDLWQHYVKEAIRLIHSE